MGLHALAPSPAATCACSLQRSSPAPPFSAAWPPLRRGWRLISQRRLSWYPRHGAVHATAMQDGHGDAMNVQELADGSLLFSFGNDGEGKKEILASIGQTGSPRPPHRLPSVFQKRSPIPKRQAQPRPIQKHEVGAEGPVSMPEGAEPVVTPNNALQGMASVPARPPSKFVKHSPIPAGVRRSLRSPPIPANPLSISENTYGHSLSIDAPSFTSSEPVAASLTEHAEAFDSDVHTNSPFSSPSSTHVHFSQPPERGSSSAASAAFISSTHTPSSNGAAFVLQPVISSLPQTPVRMAPSAVKPSATVRPTTRRQASSSESGFATSNEGGESSEFLAPSRPPSTFVKRSPISNRSPVRDATPRAGGSSSGSPSELVTRAVPRSQPAAKKTSSAAPGSRRKMAKKVEGSLVVPTPPTRPPSKFIRRSPISGPTPLRYPPAVSITPVDDSGSSASDVQAQVVEAKEVTPPVPKKKMSEKKMSEKAGKSSRVTATKRQAAAAVVSQEGEDFLAGTPASEQGSVFSHSIGIEADQGTVGAPQKKAAKKKDRKAKMENNKAADAGIDTDTGTDKGTDSSLESAALVGRSIPDASVYRNGVDLPSVQNNEGGLTFGGSNFSELAIGASISEMEETSSRSGVSSEDNSEDSGLQEGALQQEAQHGGEELKSLTLPKLKELAKAKGLKGYSKLKKSELVEALINP